MRRQSSLLLVLLAAVAGLAVGAAGCGSDQTASDEVPGDPPELTIPRSGSDDDPLADDGGDASSASRDEDSTDSADSSTDDEDAGTGSTDTSSAQPGTGTGGGTTSGGTTGGGGQTSGSTGGAPSQGQQPQQDAQNNDQPPAQGTDKFEEFCDENAGAC